MAGCRAAVSAAAAIGGRGEGGPVVVSDGVALQGAGTTFKTQAGGVAVPVSLASLDVDLPSTAGYREVLFKTPRGDVQITARPVVHANHRAYRVASAGWPRPWCSPA